ncbi:lipid II flippase MurJ [Xanthobacter agilis]|uniref:Probable lipid II flippase MurJ n=1 Tax=Xanthobacter agilis TaxID=47492 RepID=A0ABU0LDU9_XANAG|nr:lipid II flippase MurJ [Xanthobacter agilis]MDQ0505314.1 putative peptidoglycan lipid II flippase [Xanthobacter agilis]
MSSPVRMLAARTSLVSAATLASRVFGFVRDAATAAILGAGPVADALTAALSLPLLARRLLAEGAFNLAFIPALVRAEQGGPRAARRLAGATLIVLAGVLLALALVAAFFMPQLIRVLAPGFLPDGDRATVAILCGRVAVLYLPLAGLAAIYGGVANTAQRVLVAALAPLAANLTVLAVIAVLLARDLVASDVAALAIAAATVAAGFSQWFLMMGAARGCPAAPTLSPGQGGCVEPASLPWRAAFGVLRAASPALLFAGLSQFRIIIAAAFASGSEGAVAALNYAQRLMDLPLGLVGASAGAVLVPLLARHAAGTGDGGPRAAAGALLTALAFALPAAVGLAVLAYPIVVVLFQRGAFDTQDSALTANLLAVLALALPAQGLERILSATAATFGLVRGAERIALGSLGLCVLSAALGGHLVGPVGAAGAVAVSAFASLAVFVVLLARHGALAIDRRMVGAAIGLLASALAMGAVVGIADAHWTGGTDAPAQALRLAALVGLGVGVYGGLGLGFKRWIGRGKR